MLYFHFSKQMYKDILEFPNRRTYNGALVVSREYVKRTAKRAPRVEFEKKNYYKPKDPRDCRLFTVLVDSIHKIKPCESPQLLQL